MGKHEFADFAIECKNCNQMVNKKVAKCIHCGIKYPGDHDGSLQASIEEAAKQELQNKIDSKSDPQPEHSSSLKTATNKPYLEAVDCISCGQTVSQYALTCPHCGCNYAHREWQLFYKALTIIFVIIMAILGLWVLIR